VTKKLIRISEKAKRQWSVRFTGEADCDAVRTCLVLKHIPNQANKKQCEYQSQIHASLQCRRFRYQVRYIPQDRQCTYKHNIKTRSRNHCCRGKTESITYFECASVACYPARKAHAPYCQLWPVRLYNIFSTLSHKRPDFREVGVGEYWSQNVCFDFLDKLLPETFLIVRRIQWDVIIKVNKLSCKVSIIIVGF
jgi:hypothetical protein